MNHSSSFALKQAAADWRSSPGKQIQRELQAALDERDFLLTELTHRTRNTLQLVSSPLNLQTRRTDSPDARRALAEPE